MAKVLVVGGAGYVGSTTCAWLMDHGHDVWVLDDLSTGHKKHVLGRGFTQARAGDRSVVWSLLSREKFDCVMHFAARSLVGESLQKPEEYHENNVHQTQSLLEAMLVAGIPHFIFSSSCAIFDIPKPEINQGRLNETSTMKPLNPYGETKLKVEQILEQLASSRGLKAISLRYFNAAGAEPQLRVGEWHEPETHLIPRVLKAALKGTPVEIYGTDYPTPDGTCIRDYVHVWDLAAAHGAAMERLLTTPVPKGKGVFEAFNLGSENGFSVREVIRACESVTGRKLKVQEKPRRPGDPPRLIADSTTAKKVLGFRSSGDLGSMIQSAWNWEKKLRSSLKKAVFLDRDGTINEDPGYLSNPEQLKLYPGVGQALALLRNAGYSLVVVSNQSGVGRGLIDPGMMPQIHKRLDQLIFKAGAVIDEYRLCFHRPEEGCDCRKPKPKLILDAAREMGIDLGESYMIGDKVSDLFAGKGSGCRGSILVRTGSGVESESRLNAGDADFIADSLQAAANWILARENASS